MIVHCWTSYETVFGVLPGVLDGPRVWDVVELEGQGMEGVVDSQHIHHGSCTFLEGGREGRGEWEGGGGGREGGKRRVGKGGGEGGRKGRGGWGGREEGRGGWEGEKREKGNRSRGVSEEREGDERRGRGSRTRGEERRRREREGGEGKRETQSLFQQNTRSCVFKRGVPLPPPPTPLLTFRTLFIPRSI